MGSSVLIRHSLTWRWSDRCYRLRWEETTVLVRLTCRGDRLSIVANRCEHHPPPPLTKPSRFLVHPYPPHCNISITSKFNNNLISGPVAALLTWCFPTRWFLFFHRPASTWSEIIPVIGWSTNKFHRDHKQICLLWKAWKIIEHTWWISYPYEKLLQVMRNSNHPFRRENSHSHQIVSSHRMASLAAIVSTNVSNNTRWVGVLSVY